MGPTASGKTAVAEALADELDAQLISADAFQIYRGFDIGTAKPANRERYEFIDIRDPEQSFGVGEFALLASLFLADYFAAGRNVVVVGGTGLYIRALFEEYRDMASVPNDELRADLNSEFETNGLEAMIARLRELNPEVAEATQLSNPRRVIRALERELDSSPKLDFRLPPFRKRKIGLVPPLEANHRSIHERLRAMIQGGFIEEVEQLNAAGTPTSAPAMQAIGYRNLARMLAGELSGDQAFADIEIETRQYAKRQRTWLRSEPNLTMIESEGQDVVRLILDSLE